MIDHHTWRSLIYRLAEEYPDCLMLNFTIKLISDAGFQSEITSISTAAQQIEVYSRVLKTAISKFLANPDDVQKSIEECAVSYNIGNLNKTRNIFFQQNYLFTRDREWQHTDNTHMCTVKY